MDLKIKQGLKELPYDKRDFHFGNIFGDFDIKDLPKEFMVSDIIKIEDQKNTDYCSAYSSTSVREDQEGVDLDPLFTFAMTKHIEGNIGWGANLRDACLSHVKYGALKKEDTIYTVDDPRERILDYNSWFLVEKKALDHRAKSFARIFPKFGKDMFDSLRITMWQGEKQSIETGALWRPEWTTPILPLIKHQNGTPHAFKIGGWKTIGGSPYLICVLSNGVEMGEFGKFYMSREIANTELRYGCFTFIDMPVHMAKTAHTFPCLKKLIHFINNLI